MYVMYNIYIYIRCIPSGLIIVFFGKNTLSLSFNISEVMFDLIFLEVIVVSFLKAVRIECNIIINIKKI